MRLLNECKPKYFLLENVEMGEKWERVLSKAIGINGIHINSALVSAQNRKRIYWTNIGHEPGGLFGDLVCKIEQPKDRGVLLKDILESNVDEKYYLSEKAINYINRNERNLSFQMNENDNKSGCVVARYQSGIPYNQIVVHNTMPRSSTSGKGGTGHLSRKDGKTYCLDTGNTNAVEIVGLTEVRTQEAKQIRKETGTNPKRAKELVKRTDGKIGALLTSQTADNLVFSYRQDAPNDVNGKKDCLRANAGGVLRGVGIIENTSRIRRLTPLECERLQTVADGYTVHVSDSQRYKMLGNGWTVDIIVHIFNYIK
jgi:DNA (cytosine-5)-methyltransferase 3A